MCGCLCAVWHLTSLRQRARTLPHGCSFSAERVHADSLQRRKRSTQTSWTELCVQICLRGCNFFKNNHVSCSVRTLWVKCLVAFGWSCWLGWVRLHAIILFWETSSWKGGCNCRDDGKMMNLDNDPTSFWQIFSLSILMGADMLTSGVWDQSPFVFMSLSCLYSPT